MSEELQNFYDDNKDRLKAIAEAANVPREQVEVRLNRYGDTIDIVVITDQPADEYR
jgi:hypothetical protein